MESPPEVAADSLSAGTTERVKDANLEQKLRQVADEHGILPHHLKRLFLYCSLFPFGYEFRKDELVQLWIAEGFIRERHGERMEDIAGEHFNSLEKEGFFVFSRCDFTMDFDSMLSAPAENPSNFLYKVNPCKHSLLDHTMFSGNYFKAVDGKLDGASEMTRHLSLIGDDIDGMAFGILQNFKHLRTLHMLSCRGSSMKHVPRDLCFTLTFLKTLNLSGTLISELPSSIGNVKSLRYVDASHTPISRLPESTDSLYNLQTIKLRGCFHFVQLPKGMKKLKKLRHIDLDIIRQLDSMPAHLGNLSNLQTLPAFLVGRDDGCRVGELKNLNDLKGSFNISRLENVLSEDEAEEAALIEKKCIHRLELRWSDMFVEYAQQEKILECLQPHSGLKELQIQQYSGSILPTWISNPSFTDLVVITLYRCRNCKLLPCMGQLPALKSLSIIEVNEVKEINHQFFRKGLVDHAFPKLEILEVDSMLSLKWWKDVQVGDLPSLVKLTLDSCPELVTLPALLCLKSLKHLELRCCPKLMALPTGGPPTSLEFFLLLDCLELKEWCLKSEHWSMSCHVPSIWFDHEEIKGRCGMPDLLALAQVAAVAAEAQTYTRISTECSSSLSAAAVTPLPQLPAFTSRTMEPQDMPSKLLYGSKPLYSALPANEIPEWFSTESTSTPISIPTGDNKWKGVAACAVTSNDQDQSSAKQNSHLSFDQVVHHQQQSKGGDHHDVEDSFNRDMRELEELLSKLNPTAEEFVPPSHANNNHGINGGFVDFTAQMMQNGNRIGQIKDAGFPGRRRNNQGKRRMNSRTSLAQREDRIRRTVYVSDVDQQVTEEQLTVLFVTCGQVVDCRICGDPNSVLRFAFIEFTDEEGARAALSLAGTMFGFYPLRVLPSKTAIAPVNPTFLPQTEDEREMCARTIYCTNIDKKVSQADVKLFFESICGEVCRLRMLGDNHHSTRIAFVEFVMAESAIAALNCSGVVLGSLPIRVSPSKTPVRPRAPRLPIH